MRFLIRVKFLFLFILVYFRFGGGLDLLSVGIIKFNKLTLLFVSTVDLLHPTT